MTTMPSSAARSAYRLSSISSHLPRRGSVASFVLAGVLATLFYSAAGPRVTGSGGAPGWASLHNAGITGPQLAGCPIFPADSVWNTPVDKLRKAPRSEDYVSIMLPQRILHPDFGTSAGIPINVVAGTQRRVGVDFENRDESDLGSYPIAPDVVIEGGAGGEGDHHVLIVQKDRCILYELFAAARKPDGSWTAGSGIRMDLTDNALRPEGKTSADAAGLPILPGLVRYDEVAAGEIKHALRFTAPKTQHAYIWPARHYASPITDPSYPPMGARFRLRADFDISGFSKTNQVILTALKRYGMILADNGGPWFLTGATDPRWDDSDLHRLGKVKGSDFEAVDESDWQMLPDSGRVDPISLR
jgi:hypothetical protein